MEPFQEPRLIPPKEESKSNASSSSKSKEKSGDLSKIPDQILRKIFSDNTLHSEDLQNILATNKRFEAQLKNKADLEKNFLLTEVNNIAKSLNINEHYMLMK